MEKGLYQCDWETRVQTTIEVWRWKREAWVTVGYLGGKMRKEEKRLTKGIGTCAKEVLRLGSINFLFWIGNLLY